MQPVDLSELAPDPLTKAIAESAGHTVTVSGYVRTTNKDAISICKDQTSGSYVEYPRSSIAAAFRDDSESTKVTLLVASEAEVRVVRHVRASDSTEAMACGCLEIGVQQARPLGSIHPALAALAAEMRAIKDFLKKGSVELKCELDRHGRIIQGEDPEKTALEYRNCLLGFPSEGSSPGRPLW